MKNTHLYSMAIAMALFASCSQQKGYVDLNSGKTITLEKDPETGYMVNTESGKPVYLYVNTSNGDTIYGRTGKVVNTKLVRVNGEKFTYNDDDGYTYESGDYKKKVDDNGEVKVKDGDYKMKVDDDGSYKIKNGDYKKKVDEDGDIKIKDGDTKIKIKKD